MYVGGISREYIFAFPFPVFHSIAKNSRIQNHTKYNKFALPGPGGIGIFLVTSVVNSIDIAEFYIIWN